MLAGKDYIVTVEEDTFIYSYAADGSAAVTTAATASAGGLSAGDIITSLANTINTISGYAKTIGNTLKITRTDNKVHY